MHDGRVWDRGQSLVPSSDAGRPPGGEQDLLGFETLTLAPIDLALVEPAGLMGAQQAWLDAYYACVRETNYPAGGRRDRRLARAGDPTGRLRASLPDRRTDEWDDLALVAPIDPEVLPIHGDDAVTRMELAHADQTQVGKVWTAVGVALRQRLELREVVAAVEGHDRQSLAQHRQDQRHALEVEGGLRQHGLAGQQRLGDALRHPDGPPVMPIVAVREGDQEPGVRDPFHAREKPLREVRFRGPSTDPARRMNDRRESPALAFSSWSRMSLP